MVDHCNKDQLPYSVNRYFETFYSKDTSSINAFYVGSWILICANCQGREMVISVEIKTSSFTRWRAIFPPIRNDKITLAQLDKRDEVSRIPVVCNRIEISRWFVNGKETSAFNSTKMLRYFQV